MSSFLDKLNSKLRVGESGVAGEVSQSVPAPQAGAAPAANVPSASPTGTNVVPAPIQQETLPDDPPFDIDIYQSDARVVLFVQAGGISPSDLDITLDEEASTLVIQGTQKRPEVPKMKGAEELDKLGKFTKQECKWETYYRKVYLPIPVDGSFAETSFAKGVLIISLPIKKAGEGKKIKVEETPISP
ncbi:MAG: Hsp20/alpha crystallin family protein [bacterium]|nr:Hsp20/alpha crystallin family protein [bacterium]